MCGVDRCGIVRTDIDVEFSRLSKREDVGRVSALEHGIEEPTVEYSITKFRGGDVRWRRICGSQRREHRDSQAEFSFVAFGIEVPFRGRARQENMVVGFERHG